MDPRQLRRLLEQVTELHIPSPLYRRLGEQVLDNLGAESCGFLAGRIEGSSARVEMAYLLSNLCDSPDHFAISPKDHRRVLEMLETGQSLLGVFHTHGNAPTPSPKDRENMRLFNHLWLIMGETAACRLEKIESLAFMPTKSGVRQVMVQIEEEAA